jgi:hypothetical protein
MRTATPSEPRAKQRASAARASGHIPHPGSAFESTGTCSPGATSDLGDQQFMTLAFPCKCRGDRSLRLPFFRTSSAGAQLRIRTATRPEPRAKQRVSAARASGPGPQRIYSRGGGRTDSNPRNPAGPAVHFGARARPILAPTAYSGYRSAERRPRVRSSECVPQRLRSRERSSAPALRERAVASHFPQRVPSRSSQRPLPPRLVSGSRADRPPGRRSGSGDRNIHAGYIAPLLTEINVQRNRAAGEAFLPTPSAQPNL